jgi:hypothetical protein
LDEKRAPFAGGQDLQSKTDFKNRDGAGPDRGARLPVENVRRGKFRVKSTD